ncbi:LysM peptidoglycan-binding domain-containing protein [bacterium]|nr:LysM peptidoglycan-binding domain-containing protein [bacterium]
MTFFKLIGAVVFLLSSHLSSAQTEQELRLHDVYETYYSKPTDEGTWKTLTAPLKTETYKIQPGDNLWAISEIFFGDGNYWPKVWSVNSKIENPHLIQAGNEIRFRLGTAEAEPSFFITEQNALASVESSQDSVLTSEVPTSSRPKPVLFNLPASFPRWQASASSPSDFDNWGVEVVPRKMVRPRQSAYLQSVLIDQPVTFDGEIVEAQKSDEVIADGKIIYVKLRRGQFEPGKRFLLVEPDGSLKTYRSSGKVSGQVLRIAGEITLRGELTVDQPGEGYAFHRAIVNQAIGLPVPGLKLISGQLKAIDFTQAGRVSDTPVKVIGGHSDSNSFQYASGHLVFLDKGGNDGIQKGDIFVIQDVKQRQFLEAEPIVKFTQNPIGQVQVVDVSQNFATAVVLHGSGRIQTGDQSVGSTSM